MQKRAIHGLVIAGLIGGIAAPAAAVVVAGVYNTGVGAGGSPLVAGDGQVDPHYLVVASDDPSATVGGNALTYYNTAYLQDGPLSRIVNATGTDAASAGTTTTFRTTFDLTGYDLATATLSGQALFDNGGTILLNGTQVGGTFGGYTSLSPFGITSSFVGGVNTLDFVLVNADGPQAFQVAGLTVTAEPFSIVPEPATWFLMVAGFGMVGLTVRRRRSVALTA